MIHVGVDDTDSVAGGCTTYLAFDLIDVARKHGLDLIGCPRLVRLNPNVPWKTRGNGAVALTVGSGSGRRSKIGEVRGIPIESWSREGHATSTGPALRPFVDDLAAVLARRSRIEDPKTHPGLVVTGRRPPESLYRRAVSELVALGDVEGLLQRSGSHVVRLKGGRGIIGASSAIAWRARRRSFEAIAYRRPDRFGTVRRVDEAGLRRIEQFESATFHTFDPVLDRAVAVPRSPCPVLVGIRGWDRRAVVRSLLGLRSEAKDRWLLFESNQGTGDHLVRRRAPALQPFQGVIVGGTVRGPAVTAAGGHVFFEITARGAIVACAAFEPTKGFREVVRRLRTGDLVEVRGSTTVDRTLHVEEVGVRRLAPVLLEPRRIHCGRRMESVGRGQGLRCRACRTLLPRPDVERLPVVARGLEPVTYAVPIGARRHLARPVPG